MTLKALWQFHLEELVGQRETSQAAVKEHCTRALPHHLQRVEGGCVTVEHTRSAHLETKHRIIGELNIVQWVSGSSSSSIDCDWNSPTFFPRRVDSNPDPALRLLLHFNGNAGESRTVQGLPNLDENRGNRPTSFLER